jgi:hypothetical protein
MKDITGSKRLLVSTAGGHILEAASKKKEQKDFCCERYKKLKTN